LSFFAINASTHQNTGFAPLGGDVAFYLFGKISAIPGYHSSEHLTHIGLEITIFFIPHILLKINETRLNQILALAKILILNKI
jgi:hypothetical protein